MVAECRGRSPPDDYFDEQKIEKFMAWSNKVVGISKIYQSTKNHNQHHDQGQHNLCAASQPFDCLCAVFTFTRFFSARYAQLLISKKYNFLCTNIHSVDSTLSEALFRQMRIKICCMTPNQYLFDHLAFSSFS